MAGERLAESREEHIGHAKANLLLGTVLDCVHDVVVGMQVIFHSFSHACQP